MTTLDARLSALRERLGAVDDEHRASRRRVLEDTDDDVLSAFTANIACDLDQISIDYRRFRDAANVRLRWEAAVVLKRREYEEARNAVIEAGGIWCVACKQDRRVCKGEHGR